MGQSTSAAFGLALGLPDEQVVLFDSEGALLMNLGVMASVAGKKPKNFFHFLLDNECYATTGGQPVPNAQNIDYAGLAKAIGYSATYHFDDLEELVTSLEEIMRQEGPVFVSIKVPAEIENQPMGLRQRRPNRSRSRPSNYPKTWKSWYARACVLTLVHCINCTALANFSPAANCACGSIRAWVRATATAPTSAAPLPALVSGTSISTRS